jgi:hypothetical protein
MANRLQSRISELATSFVDSVLEAIRSSSLEELVGGRAMAQGDARRASAPKATAPRAARASSPGRLPRRSAEDIAKVLAIVVSLLSSRKNGLRAEQIRTELSLQSKELPRILKEGLARKKLRAVGQKRATTYFAR